MGGALYHAAQAMCHACAGSRLERERPRMGRGKSTGMLADRRTEMKKILGALLAAALAVPAVGWAGSKALQSRASAPCGNHCPFPDCPLKK